MEAGIPEEGSRVKALWSKSTQFDQELEANAVQLYCEEGGVNTR